MPASTFPELSAEHRLILGLAEGALGGDGAERVQGALREGVKWERFVQEADRHAMVPLVYHRLKASYPEAAPQAVAQQLRQLFLAKFEVSLHMQSVLPELLARFDSRGVKPLLLKGPALAATAYGTAKHRPFTDLDFLVRPSEARTADAALTEAGFRRVDPLPKRFASHWKTYWPWQPPHQNAVGYVRGQGARGVAAVDLHWGVASRYFLFPMDSEAVWDRRVRLTFDSAPRAHTFSPEDAFLFLCMHAAKHHWSLLRFAADLAALSRAHPDLDWKAMMRRARGLRSLRMTLLGAGLAARLFGAPVPAWLQSACDQHPGMRALTSEAARLLFGSTRGAEGLWRTCRFHLRVRDRMRDGLGACWYQLQLSARPNRSDREWLPLPAPLSPLYHLVRPVRILAKKYGRA